MSSADKFSELIDNIFYDNQIDSTHLKEFLTLLSHEIKPVQPKISNYIQCVYEEVKDEETQVNYLQELIAQCEKQIEHLKEYPKTKVVIRNEGHKLDAIIESLGHLKIANDELQAQVDANEKKLKKVICEKKTPTFEDMASCLKKQSIDSDVCELKRQYYAMENQVQELAVKYEELKSRVDIIEDKIECVSSIPTIEENVLKLLDWRAAQREEFDLMTERYEHIKVIKISKNDVENMIENKVNYKTLCKYVSKVSFNLARDEFSKEFDDIKELFCQLQMNLTSKLVELHRDVQTLFKNMRSLKRLEKRSIKKDEHEKCPEPKPLPVSDCSRVEPQYHFELKTTSIE